MKKKTSFIFDLQLFADGAGGAGAGITGASSGVSSGSGSEANGDATGVRGLTSSKRTGARSALSQIMYGVQTGERSAVRDAGAQTEDAGKESVENTGSEDAGKTGEKGLSREEQFEQLIKGEYKDLYGQKVSDTVRDRVKNLKESLDRYEAAKPMLDALAEKYKISGGDLKALNEAYLNDLTNYEDEALISGKSTEEVRDGKKRDLELETLREKVKRYEADERANAIYSSWMQEAEKLKSKYPSFDVKAEMGNPTFEKLLKNGIDMETAFETIHRREITEGKIREAINRTEEKITNSIAANGRRPAENAQTSHSPVSLRTDVTKMTREERAEIARIVAQGGRVILNGIK